MNPFKKNHQLLPIASLNRLYVDGDQAYDLFHSFLIKKTIIDAMGSYVSFKLDDYQLSELMEIVMKTNNETLIHQVNSIVLHYAHQLAKIIATLFMPSELSIRNHPTWSDQHFRYWQSINTLYLAGGALIDAFIEPFKAAIHMELSARNIDKNVYLLPHSDDLGMKGMASLFDQEGTALLLDLGQTSIKRALKIHYQGTKNYLKLSSVPSKHLFTEEQTETSVNQSASMLHEYLTTLVIDTIHEQKIQPIKLYMSVANYVNHGSLQPGLNSYGKLDHIARPYDIYLEKALTKRLGYPIEVRLFHDASAMALNFKDQEKTAIISVGTAFGVGFTEN